MKMKYIGETEREIPQHGLFKPGDEVEHDEILFKTGLFEKVDKTKKKKGDE